METSVCLVARRAAKAIREDIEILSGDSIGPSDASWQDVAGTLQCNLHVLGNLIDRARTGGENSFIPCLSDWILGDD